MTLQRPPPNATLARRLVARLGVEERSWGHGRELIHFFIRQVSVPYPDHEREQLQPPRAIRNRLERRLDDVLGQRGIEVSRMERVGGPAWGGQSACLHGDLERQLGA